MIRQFRLIAAVGACVAGMGCDRRPTPPIDFARRTGELPLPDSITVLRYRNELDRVDEGVADLVLTVPDASFASAMDSARRDPRYRPIDTLSDASIGSKVRAFLPSFRVGLARIEYGRVPDNFVLVALSEHDRTIGIRLVKITPSF